MLFLPPREPQPPQRSGKGSLYWSFRYLDNWRLLNFFCFGVRRLSHPFKKRAVSGAMHRF
jgi:hypothetical protein